MARLRGSVIDDNITGYASEDNITGGYGNDQMAGNAGNDRLDGGRGSDILDGGDGDDLILSRSDGGETAIAQEVNANNDPNNEVDAETVRIYADQAGLPADDVLTGGAGADTFRFETLIAAKQEILEKHADPNSGRIDYSMMGVAGENDLVHDHWVDGIGNDVITDFNAGEGDRIEIAGHTTEVSEIRIVDADGDGQADDTVLQLRSNQGANGGAHNLDLLGTITVLNNQLTENDFTVDAGVNYGIVENISEVNEAIRPLNPGMTAAPNPEPNPEPSPDPGEDPSPEPEPEPNPDPEPTPDPEPNPDPAPTGSVLDELMAPPEGSAAGTAPTRGDDVVIYGDGDDNGNGGMGDDLVLGLAGDDALGGGWGDDLIDGGAGDDHVHGNHGDDVIAGRDGDDSLSGDFGSDILVGGAGSDVLKGGRGDDVMFGGADDDELRGGTGDDILMGGAGDDRIDGGRGMDALLLEGAIADYQVNVAGNEIQFTNADNETDIVTRVEQFRFLGSGETYVIENGALALTADTEDLDDLISDHLVEQLIAEETGSDSASSQADAVVSALPDLPLVSGAADEAPSALEAELQNA